MAARRGFRREDVIAAAEAILVERGSVDAVTLADVAARLGVKTPSLYAHIEGLDDLRRELALRSLPQLAKVLQAAGAGRTGRDAVSAIIRAYVDFAIEHPGLYSASFRAPGDDAALREATDATTAPLDAALRSYGFDDDACTHWYRVVFAAVHGFATFRRENLFTYPTNHQQTLDHLIQVFTDQLDATAPAPQAAAAPSPRRRRPSR